MCFVVFAWKYSKEFPLILGFNRDEFVALEALPAHQWESGFIAGKHLPHSANPGAWMGVAPDGRFAALTNVRDFGALKSDKLSRGSIVRDYLSGSQSPHDYLQTLSPKASSFNPFNLLVGTSNQLYFFTNHPQVSQTEISPGVHGLSNGKFNEPWPKVERGKTLFNKVLSQPPSNWTQSTLALLKDTHQPDDSELPDTKVGLELERLCAPIFMQQVDIEKALGNAREKKPLEKKERTYGTRTSTVLLMDNRNARLTEVTFAQGKEVTRVDLTSPILPSD